MGECERGLSALGDELKLDAGEGVVQLAERLLFDALSDRPSSPMSVR